MKVYLDLVFFMNFGFDFLLLLTVNLVLKRNRKLSSILLGSLIGALSIFFLFLPLNSITLFLLKLVISLLMIWVAFGFFTWKTFLINTLYLYFISILLGGFLYYLNLEFSYQNQGLLFFHNGFSINYIVLLIIAPIILFLYIKEQKRYKSTIKYNMNVSICFKNGKILNCNGFLDTGNKLRDPITHKYVILLSKKLLVPYINNKSPIYVPYKVVGYSGLVECFSIRYLKINNSILNNYLVGIIPDEMNKISMDCLLNYKIMEDICLEN